MYLYIYIYIYFPILKLNVIVFKFKKLKSHKHSKGCVCKCMCVCVCACVCVVQKLGGQAVWLCFASCSVLPCVFRFLQCDAVCCRVCQSVLQFVAVCCSVIRFLQCRLWDWCYGVASVSRIDKIIGLFAEEPC